MDTRKHTSSPSRGAGRKQRSGEGKHKHTDAGAAAPKRGQKRAPNRASKNALGNAPKRGVNNGRNGAPRNASKNAPAHGHANGPKNGRGPTAGSSPKAVQAHRNPAYFCPIDAQCGGCELLWQPYAEQLADKQRNVEDLFEPLFDDFDMKVEGPGAAGSASVSAPAPVCAPTSAPVSAGSGKGSTGLVRFDAIAGMDVPLHYRDKVLSPFVGVWDKRARRERILCGMYARGTHRVIDSSECLIENELAKKIILDVRDLMVKFHIPPYDEDADEGFMRHAQVRVGHNSGEVMVTLVTRDEAFPSSRHFARELVRRHPEVTTVVQNINERQTNVVLGDKERTLYGPGFILDTLCGLTFRISSKSFYQVNSTQTEVLYRRAVQMAHLTGTERVLDAYCGTGTIGLVAMRGADPDHPRAHAAELIGVEERRDAVADARMNARHNGIERAQFVAEDAGAFMRKLAADARATDTGEARTAGTADVRAANAAGDAGADGSEARATDGAGTSSAHGIDVVFMDPPRAGSTPEFLKALDLLAPSRVVYISCNPLTQVRDVRFLCDRGWRVEEVQPVDMFPHTKHVENIVAMVRA